MQAVIVADVGNALTKLALLVNVEGELRVVAERQLPSSAAPPTSDVLHGVMSGLRSIEVETGRHLVSGTAVLMPSRKDGHGADYFLASASAGEPLHLLIVAGEAQASRAREVEEMLVRTCSIPLWPDLLLLADKGQLPMSLLSRWQDQPIDSVLFISPDKLPKYVSSAVDNLMHFLAMTARTRGPRRLQLYFLGTQADVDACGLTTSEDVGWQPLMNADSPLGPAVATLESHLDRLYRDARQRSVPGLVDFAECLSSDLQTSVQALSVVAQSFSKSIGPVTIVDVGATATAVVACTGDVLVRGQRAGVGLGQGTPRLVAEAGVGRVLRWLPYSFGPNQLEELAYQRVVSPWSVPATVEDLQLDAALAIEAIGLALRSSGGSLNQFQSETIVAAGGFFRANPDPTLAAFVLLSAIQPVGRARLLVDSSGVVTSVATLAEYEPGTISRLFQMGGLQPLGTCFGISGTAKSGETALEVKVLDGPRAGRVFSVPFGSLRVLPVEARETVTLEVRPARGLSIGLRPGEGARAEGVEGGSAGVVFDARARPVSVPIAPAAQHAELLKWMTALHAD